MQAGPPRFYFLVFFVIPVFLVILKSNCQQVIHSIVSKKITRQTQTVENYTLEYDLSLANEECSYLTLNKSLPDKNGTLQKLRDEINSRSAIEFYRQKEEERRRSREYYEKVERESRRRVLEESTNWGPRPRRPLRLPRPVPPWEIRNVFRRSPRSNKRRPLNSSFFNGSLRDHNNCTSRCIFARLGMVDNDGFPQEHRIIKLLEDKIRSKRVKTSKINNVTSCFKNLEKVAIDDNCIVASELFRCMHLGDRSAWSGISK